MRLTDDTAKLRWSMGAEAAVGRRATAGRRSLEAMVAVVVKYSTGGVRALLEACVRWRGKLEGSIDQLENWKECWLVSRMRDIFGSEKRQLIIN